MILTECGPSSDTGPTTREIDVSRNFEALFESGQAPGFDWPDGSAANLTLGRDLSPSSKFPHRFERIVRSAADRYSVDSNLVWAVMKVESDFNPRAVSHRGARGLMQLMPVTARLHNVGDIYDPTENINAGARHLKSLLDRFQGDLRLALAAYNAGVGAVKRYEDVPPFSETRRFVRRVLKYYQIYRAGRM
ncbi:MAG: lytic transglycosylase domain-containing protein [bacterium]